MKKIYCLVLICLLCFGSSGQTFFANYPTLPSEENIEIVKCIDGNFMIASQSFNDTVLSIIKMDAEGNPITGMKLKMPNVSILAASTLATDSTIVFLFYTFSPTDCAVLLKIDNNCNLIWSEGLSITAGATFMAMAPGYEEGSVVLGGGACANHDLTIVIDRNGNTIHQTGHDNPSNPLNIIIFGLVKDDDGFYSGWGGSSSGLAFCRIDSLGNVNDVSVFPSMVARNGFRGKCIATSFSGGHYCTVALEDSSQKFPITIFYFDANDQFVWAKTIESDDTALFITAIIPTDDNGCILVGMDDMTRIFVMQAGYPMLPFFMRFDSTGIVRSIKMAGDTTVAGWRHLNPRNVIKNSANDLFCTLFGQFSGGLGVCVARTDTLLTGFCHTGTLFDPTINIIHPPVVNIPVINTHINFFTTPLGITSSPENYHMQEICSTTSLEVINNSEEDFIIYPNPTSGKFIVSTEITAQPKTLEVRSPLGQLLLRKKLADNNIPVDLGKASPGIYFVRLISADVESTVKIMVDNQ